MGTQVASLYGLLELDDSQFNRGLKNAEAGMKGLSGHLGSLESNLKSMGGKLTTFVTLPLAAAFGLATKSAIDFDEAMTNAAAVTGVVGDEADDLRKEILRMGRTARAGPQKVAEAYYEIVSGVADASTHMAILDAAIRTSEAGAADLGATTSALIATMNSYGYTAQDAAFVSDVFTRTVGMGVGSMDQFAEAFPQVTGVAKSMGIEFDVLAGQVAYLTTQGYSASVSANLLKSAMTTMLNPTTALADAIGAMGYSSGEAMVSALGLDGALAAIRDYGGGSFAGLITGQEALQAALALTGDGADEFFTAFEGGIDGATEAARNIQMSSAAAQFDLLKASIQTVGIEIGTKLLPVFVGVVQLLTPLLIGVAAWIGANPELATGIMMVVGGLMFLGPALSLVGTGIGFVTGAAKVLTITFGVLHGGGVILWGGIKALGLMFGVDLVAGLAMAKAAFLGVIAPIVLVVAAGIALGVAIYGLLDSVGIVDKMRIGFEIGMNLIKLAIQIVIDTLQGLIDKAKEAIEYVESAFNIAAENSTKHGGHGGLFGSGFGPDWDPLGFIRAPIYGDGGGTNQELGTYWNDLLAPDTAGGRATGGDVFAGRPYMVGERGPELFVPRTTGSIIPNGQSGGGETYNVTVYANSYTEGREAARGFEAGVRDLRRRRG